MPKIAVFQHVKLDEVLKALARMNGEDERLEWLGLWYPCLFVHVAQTLGKEQELLEYMEENKNFENDYKNYSHYVHGYFWPWV